MGVGERHRHGRTGTARRADGAEQIGALVALVLGLTRTAAGARPLPDDAVLLAKAHLVLPPQLDRRCGRQVGYRRGERPGEVSLNVSSIAASWPGWRTRALMCEKPRSCSRRETERS